jgi:transcriptional regulator with XRE-family HTH domain
MPPERKSEPSNPNMAALSEAIALHRKEKGMSLQAVADGCDLNYEHLNELARGQGNPTFDTLMKLCDGLKTPIGELMMSVQRIRGGRAGG